MTGPGNIVELKRTSLTETTPTPSAITTHNLSVRFGNIVAVKGLNLHVPEMCVYGFLGPNGAGKTTTIRTLLGLIRPTEGRATLFGKAMPQEKISILRDVGSIVEDPALYLHATGYDNLRISQIILRCDKKRIDEVLELVDLEKDAHRRVGDYSMGMKQRLALARALLGKPRLLILDEPTNGLDPAGIQEMRNLIRAFPKEFGVTVFLSSHLLSEIEQIADKVGIVKDGAMVFEGELNELRKRFPGHAKIRTDNNEKAKIILEEQTFPLVALAGSEAIWVHCDGERDIARMTSALVKNGLSVFYVAMQERSLENIFLSLTGGQQ